MLPYENTYWVKEGSFIAGCYPGALREKLPQHVQALVEAGVDVVISLLESNETYSDGTPYIPYDENFLQLANRRGLRARYYNYPIPDFGIPDAGKMKQILDEIDSSLAAGHKVFVHCWGGKGRTGTVVGCWLARHGADNPLEILGDLRKNCLNAEQPSPETETQCAFVRNWQG
ncbi:MAG: dual specificity protein phosphatase family protein [Desulfovibrionaceae bacterium]|nr:dual specificity protein phosphatase family protein [Desulfovibrionaceae bacterium]